MLKVCSLFSGIGGIDLGFIQAGFQIVWANEFDKDAARTKVILYFTDDEYIKTQKILKEIGLDNCKDIVLINAIGNKPSASNATSIND